MSASPPERIQQLCAEFRLPTVAAEVEIVVVDRQK